jgi:hypothetical protein
MRKPEGGAGPERHADFLASLGASKAETAELLAYNDNVFDLSAIAEGTVLPLPDEPFVAAWEGYARAAREQGVFRTLQERLPQLRFPIRKGISQTPAYQDATRRGAPIETVRTGRGLRIGHPEAIELDLYLSPAGRIPVLILRDRQDFVILARALAMRNEPRALPTSLGAFMVSGFNNWDRIGALRRRWEAADPAEREAATWSEEFARIVPHRELYQDRFILLSDGPYSAVPAAELGLADADWRELSLVLRRDHECTHYFTQRLFGSMRNNLLDELMADYAGIVGALGFYRADWFLRFLGLEAFPAWREGGRIGSYRGDPPLSDGAFRVLQALVKHAAENLEDFDRSLPREGRGLGERALVTTALAALRLEDLAAPEGPAYLRRTVEDLREKVTWREP